MNRELKLLSSLLPEDGEHLQFDELEAAARGEANEHLLSCETCAAEVEDLRAFGTNWNDGLSARRQRLWLPLAAAIVLLLATAAFLAVRRNAGRAEALRLAEVTIPAEVIAMRGERLQLRGAAAEEALAVLAPVGTVVVSDRPLFRWNAPAGARVKVEVFDESFRPVAQSGVVAGNQWSPAEPLPRDRTYVWQVVTIDDRRLAPAPPLPDARFRIVPAEAARRIESAKEAAPSLELASLYAGAGALDDAGRELERLLAAGRDDIAVRRLRDRVDNLR
ncbi:MAG TPA: hypothetical protein VGF28_06265 [Thermoanaerobaculia bacterium]|jgi:hypothetical protein